MKGRGPQPIERRLWSMISPEPNSGCWLWTGYTNGDGYGGITIGIRSDGSRRFARAHRISFELYRGPIPDGLELDHKCRVRCCVNPDPREPVTHRPNVLRGNVRSEARRVGQECVSTVR